VFLLIVGRGQTLSEEKKILADGAEKTRIDKIGAVGGGQFGDNYDRWAVV
jgi:hypothetical protein